MALKVALGQENFISLRSAGSYYVDKTELLYELFSESDNAVTLFTRPRRFGKTLTMRMIESFFSMFVDQEDARTAYAGLDVMKHMEFCEKNMNQHPVIFITLKDVEGLDFESALGMMRHAISDMCSEAYGLGDNENVDPYDKEQFMRLSGGRADVSDMKNSLKMLARMMYKAYGRKVIILIDEYDVPLAKAQANGYYREMLDFIRGFMSTSLKTNDYLYKAVVTGCLRIPKESIFTGVNNFASYSVLDDRFSQYFGFTDQEVDRMLEAFGFSDKKKLIKKWYDGYHFGNSEVYCPWDVAYFLSDLLADRNARPKNYWENTSGNTAIREFFNLEDSSVSEEFETLLNGGTITTTVTDALTYDNAYDSEENLWSILLMTGYVTTQGDFSNAQRKNGRLTAELRIPNMEVTDIFEAAVVDHFRRTADTDEIRNLMNSLWEGDTDTATDILSDLLWNTISYMDYGEDYYHAFLTGVFVGRGKYHVKSNKEQGEGRLDVEVRDRPNRRAFIIEAKVADSREGMTACCDQALAQIADRGYDRDESFYGYRQIICYGVAFFKKEALVKKNSNFH